MFEKFVLSRKDGTWHSDVMQMVVHHPEPQEKIICCFDSKQHRGITVEPGMAAVPVLLTVTHSVALHRFQKTTKKMKTTAIHFTVYRAAALEID